MNTVDRKTINFLLKSGIKYFKNGSEGITVEFWEPHLVNKPDRAQPVATPQTPQEVDMLPPEVTRLNNLFLKGGLKLEEFSNTQKASL